MEEERSSSSSDAEDLNEEDDSKYPNAIDLFLQGAFASGWPTDR